MSPHVAAVATRSPDAIFLALMAGGLARTAECAITEGHSVQIDAATARKLAHAIEGLLAAQDVPCPCGAPRDDRESTFCAGCRRAFARDADYERRAQPPLDHRASQHQGVSR